jgi:hypothetical protein
MTKKDKEQLQEMISYEIGKNFRKLEKKILQEVVGEPMAELVKLSLMEVFDEMGDTDKDTHHHHDHDSEASNLEESWPFKVYGGRNFVPMSTKQFVNVIRAITDRAVEDNLKNKLPFTNHEAFVEALNIGHARNAQVFALKQIYDLIRWSSKNDELQGRMGKIAEA